MMPRLQVRVRNQRTGDETRGDENAVPVGRELRALPRQWSFSLMVISSSGRASANLRVTTTTLGATLLEAWPRFSFAMLTKTKRG